MAPELRTANRSPAAPAASDGSPIVGLEGLEYRLGGCCSPLPGEAIVGTVALGNHGITIHRQDCGNVGQVPVERRLPVRWNPQAEVQTRRYPVRLVESGPAGGAIRGCGGRPGRRGPGCPSEGRAHRERGTDRTVDAAGDRDDESAPVQLAGSDLAQAGADAVGFALVIDVEDVVIELAHGLAVCSVSWMRRTLPDAVRGLLKSR